MKKTTIFYFSVIALLVSLSSLDLLFNLTSASLGFCLAIMLYMRNTLNQLSPFAGDAAMRGVIGQWK
jgi:hypothetical protein